MRASLILLVAITGCTVAPAPDAAKVRLGKRIFEDPGMSQPVGQACADCHAARSAFRDPESDHATSMGIVPGRFGARNAPSITYTAATPELHLDGHRLVGGQFWDGRADDLERQAEGPLLNPAEMNNPDRATVVAAARRAPYAREFTAAFGPGALDDVDTGFAHVTEALAAFERSPELAPFSSKYDGYLAGTATLAPKELAGLAIFEGKGQCASCHPSRPGADGAPPMFTTFGYANLGVPRYGNNGFYTETPEINPLGERYIDHGLMTTTHDAADDGKFRIPTLRNVAKTAPYGHNGYFANLPYFLDFLNTRDVGSTAVGTCSRVHADATCIWPAPEVATNLDREHAGNLGLTPGEIESLTAFLGTLTDR